MSAKKSWDIAPRRRAATTETAKQPASRPSSAPRAMDMRAPTRAKAPAAVPTSVSKRNVTISRGKKARPESKEPLKKRRKKTQKTLGIAMGIAALIFAGVAFYLVWLPALRVSTVEARGPHAEEARQLAEQALWGTHAFVLPRNSLFFIPEDDMRARILENHPDIEAVSISATGLTSLLVTTLPRAEAFVWCGVTADTSDGQCYSANAEGLIFAPVPPETASTSAALRFHTPIEGQEGESPVRAQIVHAAKIPEVLRFVKAIQELGAQVVSVSFRDDEADLYTEAGTRITYVLGREEEAAGIAASVFPQLALNNGTIAYVDLRFSGKAYFKRKAEVVEE